MKIYLTHGRRFKNSVSVQLLRLEIIKIRLKLYKILSASMVLKTKGKLVIKCNIKVVLNKVGISDN